MTNLSTVYSATEARNEFFNLLNKIIYGGETVYVTKAGANMGVKLKKSKVPLSTSNIRLAGDVGIKLSKPKLSRKKYLKVLENIESGFWTDEDDQILKDLRAKDKKRQKKLNW